MAVTSIDRIKAYLRSVDAVKGYVVAGEGLIIEYEGIGEDKAEELAAWSYNVLEHAGERLGVGELRLLILEAENEDVIVSGSREETLAIIAVSSYGSHVAHALKPGSIRCGSCRRDLSNTIVLCPACGARNPFPTPHCVRCGASLEYRRCPYCGSLLYPNGLPASLRGRLLASRRAARVIVPSPGNPPGSRGGGE